MPGMNFKSRGNRNTVITNDNQKQHLQDFNFTLQPLLGVGKNIRNMIEPEESDIVLEESSLLSSYSTNYNNDNYSDLSSGKKNRPKRKAPPAPSPSGRFIPVTNNISKSYSNENTDYTNNIDITTNNNYNIAYPNGSMHKKVKTMENRDEEESNLQPRDKVPIPTPQKVNSLTSNPNNGSPNRNNNNKKIDIIPDDIDNIIVMNDVMNTNKHYKNNHGSKNNDGFKLDNNSSNNSSPFTTKPSVFVEDRLVQETVKVEEEDIVNPVLNEKFADGRIHVVARCRPKIEEDNHADIDTYKKSVFANKDECKIILKRDFCQDRMFEFDNVLSENSTQKETFDVIAEDVVKSVETGINGTIMCYGQTGGGKTYTAFGTKIGTDTAGIVPRCVEHLFRYADAINKVESQRAVIRVSLLQIYMENITDLLRGDTKPKKRFNPLLSKHHHHQQQKQQQMHLQIREDSHGNIFVQDLSCLEVRNPENVLSIIKKAMDSRISGETKQNSASSRSHAVLQLHLEQSIPVEDNEDSVNNSIDNGNVLLEGEKVVKTRYSTLSIVDLAGSERVAKSRSKGQRLQEARKINKSIAALGNCISALAEAHSSNKVSKLKRHIPFRNSQLTRLLTDSLGGNTRTCLCVNVGPAMANFEETYASMLLARRAMQVRNCAEVNEAHELIQEPLEEELEEKEEEIQGSGKLHISTISEDDIESKQKTLFMAMSTPLASSKKQSLFFADDSSSTTTNSSRSSSRNSGNDDTLNSNNSHLLIKQYEKNMQEQGQLIISKDSENNKLSNINKENKNIIENLKCENKNLHKEISDLKDIIGRLEHTLQQQKQQINAINNSSDKDNLGWEIRENELVSKFTSIIHNLQMEIAKQNVSIAKLRKSVSDSKSAI